MFAHASSRVLLFSVITLVFAAGASAQSPSPRAGRVRTPIRDGGTLRLATGEWSRSAADGESARRTVFNNDAAQPYFLKSGPRRRVADFGQIPSGTAAAPMVGSVDGQGISGFQFAYSTREQRGGFGYVVTFFDDQAPCIEPDNRRVAARIRLMDLPGAPRPGVQANWRVTIDLRGSEHEFVLGRDAEGGGAPARFGWSLVNTNNEHGPGGPILAGDPLGFFGPAAGAGNGTDWHGDAGAPGTGLGSEDGFWVDQRGPDRRQGCVTGIPNAPISFGSFHLQLYANAGHSLGGSTNIGTNYCDGSSALFEDGFEGEDLNAEGWTRSGSYSYPEIGDAWAGLWKVVIPPTGRLTKAISTVGIERVTLRYARSTRHHMPVYQSLWAEWSDGQVWTVLEQTRDSEWAARSFDLPPEAGNNPDFKFRFRNGGGATNNPQVLIDNVRLDRTGAPHLAALGSTSVADNQLTLVASGLPVGTFGLFFYGPAEAHAPLGNGIRCVGGQPVRRLRPPVQADAGGLVTRTVDLGTGPELSGITNAVPLTIYIQYWFRENGSSNLTDALRIHFVE